VEVATHINTHEVCALRLPKRTRGLLLGTVALVAGPAVAITLASSPAQGPSSPSPAASFVTAAVPIHNPVPRMLRDNPPLPPSPAPKPTPRLVRPLNVVHAVVVPRVSYPAGSIEAIIEAAAQRWGVSGSWMISIAHCESGLRPNAYNPRGPYYGLFQFLMSTFTHNGGTNIWDPADQANIAAKMLAHGQAYQWSCA
jgi:soluble lytic murein transglycosylase-like protein